jgi:DNA (cytosine-5)-methyltransferase 1
MKLLDLFCGAGGAAAGYWQAGFQVHGVDQKPQPRYPFPFTQADALEYLASVKTGEFALIHASPPCQAYSTATAARHRGRHPDLVGPVRDALVKLGTPWVIENVPGAPMNYHVTLCGTMFGLRVYRHRRFETSHLVWQPSHPEHRVKAGGHKAQRQRKAHYLAGGFVTITGHVGTYCGPAMGIGWMTGAELTQAIPPAYTRWLGEQLR